MKILKSKNYLSETTQKNDKFNIIILLLITIMGGSLVVFFQDYPISIIYFLQYILIFYIFSHLKIYKLSLLLFLYPFFKFIFYQTYDSDWNTVGDLFAYVGLLSDAFSKDGINMDSLLVASSVYNRFYFLTIINMYLPMILFSVDYASDQNYILLYFNDLVFLTMVTYTSVFFKGVLKDKFILYFVLFLLFSPTLLALTWQPDRHIFSLFALILFVRGYMEWKSKHKIINLYMILAFVIFFLNKPPLLLAVGLIFLLDWFRTVKNKGILFPLFIIMLLSFVYIFKDIFLEYSTGIGSNLGEGFASSFQGGSSVLGWLLIAPLKYIYAILSPFPWYKYDGLISNAGGSYVVVAVMYLNSVFGLSILIALIKYYKRIKKQFYWYYNFIWIGMIFSLSIILAHIGHSGYLSIYYILFLPIFFIIGYKKTFSVFAFGFLFIVTLNLLLFSIGF